MQIVTLESLSQRERTNHARQGVFKFYQLLEGETGALGNFSLQLVSLYGDFLSPRHRHNFDQVRYQVEGHFDYAADGKLEPGSLAYFPEGTRYGPQSSSDESLTLVLQFGGASRSGFMSEAQYDRGVAELKKIGQFEKGVFTRFLPDGTKVNQDAYEAVWEHVNGRVLAYPPARYAHPVFMSPASFSWVPLPGAPGASVKRMGTFGESQARLAFFRVEEDAYLSLEPNSLYFVVSGRGRAGDTSWGRHSTLYVPSGGTGTIRAEKSAELLQMGLHDLQ